MKAGDEAHELGSLEHLGDIRDPRIVPALNALLSSTRSGRVVEAVVAALDKQQDPRSLPALRAAARNGLDDFLMLNISQTQLSLGDPDGFATLIAVLKGDGAAYARQQALDLLERRSGRSFGYNAALPAADNSSVLRNIEQWYGREGASFKPLADPNAIQK